MNRAARPYEHTPLTVVRACAPLSGGQPLFETLVVFEDYILEKRMQRIRQNAYRRLAEYYERDHVVCDFIHVLQQVGIDNIRAQPSISKQ